MALGDLFQSDLNTGAHKGLSVRPTQEMVVIKHDSRVGGVSLIVPDNDPNDRESRGSIVDVDKLEFVPLTVATMVKAEGTGSNASYSAVFDVYKYGDRNSKSLGIFDRNGAYENTGATSVYRVIGVLRSVDGKSIAKLGNELSEKFGSKPVPAYLDLTYAKFNQMTTVAPDYDKGGVITLTKGKDNKLIQKTPKAKYWLPIFSFQPLDEESANKFETYVKDFFEETKTWIEAVHANDAFLGALRDHGITAPNSVNKLRNMGLDDYEKLVERVKSLGNNDENAGFTALAKQLDVAQTSAPAKSDDDSFDDGSEIKADENVDPFHPNGDDTEVDVSDDDLPF